jgi:hypothetical protein
VQVLIAIFSCNFYEQNGFDQAVRDTWLKDVPAVPGFDYQFFVGRGDYALRSDVTRLDVDDSLAGLSHKAMEIRRWALDAGYDYVFQSASDTYVRPERLKHSGFELHDYAGFPIANEGCPDIIEHFDLCGGGGGYWTSRRACEKIVAAAIDDAVEDRWIGRVMKDSGIVLFPDARYNYLPSPSPLKSNDIFTCHLSEGTGNYSPQRMHETHEAWLKS